MRPSSRALSLMVARSALSQPPLLMTRARISPPPLRALLPLRPLHVSPWPPAKANKGASGKKKGKGETVGVPQGFNMDMLARDWAAWEHGEKLDLSLPWAAGAEPAWLQAIMATADSNGILQWSPRKVKAVDELQPEVHGLRYTWQRLRKERILRDNLGTPHPQAPPPPRPPSHLTHPQLGPGASGSGSAQPRRTAPFSPPGSTLEGT